MEQEVKQCMDGCWKGKILSMEIKNGLGQEEGDIQWGKERTIGVDGQRVGR